MRCVCVEAATGCSRPVASCHPAVRNVRIVMSLIPVRQPARYFNHELHKFSNLYKVRCNAFSEGSNEQKRFPFLMCRAAGTDKTSVLDNLYPEEIEKRIKRAANYITTSEKLIPYDPSSTNLGLVIWQAIRDIPPKHRPQLISRLSSG